VRLIDLSHPVVPFDQNPWAQFPAAPKNMVGLTGTFEGVGWFSRAWYLGEHCGTHVDASLHFNPDGQPVDAIPLEDLCGPAVIFDLSHKPARADVTVADLGAALDRAGGALGDARIVLIRSDRSKLWGRPEYHHDMLNMTPEATEWLIRQGARVLGTDGCVWEVDRGTRPENLGRTMTGAERFPSHALMRTHHFLILENVANLHQVPVPRFTFVGLPLRLVGGSGSPIRAAAMLSQ
jgi:kynurenine formamidase